MRFNPVCSKLLIATRNQHKVGEIQAILGTEFRCQTLKDFPGVPAVVEDLDTFAGNATKKAAELARWLTAVIRVGRRPDYVLADDSGLAVDALGGAPGVHSARFAALDSGQAGNSPDVDNNTKLLRQLQDVPADKRTARFHCAIALVKLPESVGAAAPRAELFEGDCVGRIDFAPRGQGGFGYDPLFVPVGYEVSFAELGESAKNQISHRARALEKLRAHFAGRA
ncbi:MAG: non-canonical purine NTP pyrophosphatase [Verrucomicrobiota bacterium]